MSALSYTVVDVFTRRRFEGNPLAVVFGADGLPRETLQKIAREFNFSETSFVLKPRDPSFDATLRIFTTVEELPFAGHPNVGAGYVVGRRGEVFGRLVGESLRFDEVAGPVAVSLRRAAGATTGAEVAAPRAFEILGEAPAGDIAACAGLAPEEIDTSAHPPVAGTVGLAFVIARVASLKALARAKPDLAAFERSAPAHGHERGFKRMSLFLYALEAADGSKARARMFAPMSDTWEDPATGSASAALGGLLATLSGAESFETRVAQGVEMGRPSEILVSARRAEGGVRVTLGGECVEVMRGEILLD